MKTNTRPKTTKSLTVANCEENIMSQATIIGAYRLNLTEAGRTPLPRTTMGVPAERAHNRRACSFLRSTLTALALLFGLGSSAWAGDLVYHGSLCNAAAADQVNYNQYGAHNSSSSASAFVNCGTAPSILSTIRTVSVIVYDRDPDSNVTCTVVLADIFGTALWSGTGFSSGSGANFQVLNFNPNVSTHTINLQCSIPPATSEGLSHVTSYRVITP